MFHVEQRPSENRAQAALNAIRAPESTPSIKLDPTDPYGTVQSIIDTRDHAVREAGLEHQRQLRAYHALLQQKQEFRPGKLVEAAKVNTLMMGAELVKGGGLLGQTAVDMGEMVADAPEGYGSAVAPNAMRRDRGLRTSASGALDVGQRRSVFGGEMMKTPDEPVEASHQVVLELAQGYAKKLEEMAAEIDYVPSTSFGGQIAEGVAGSIPHFVGGIAVGGGATMAGGPIAGAAAAGSYFGATEGLMFLGETYTKLREQGLSYEEARTKAIGSAGPYALGSAALEFAGAGTILRGLKLGKYLEKTAARPRWQQAVGGIGLAGVGEGTTEVAQGILADAISSYAQEDWADFSERFNSDVNAQEFIVGAILGGGARSVGEVVNPDNYKSFKEWKAAMGDQPGQARPSLADVEITGPDGEEQSFDTIATGQDKETAKQTLESGIDPVGISDDGSTDEAFIGKNLGAFFDQNETTGRVVAAKNDRQKQIQDGATSRGLNILYVESDEDKALSHPAAYIGRGTILLDANATDEQVADSLRWHESVHAVEDRNPEAFVNIYALLAEELPTETAAALAEYRARWRAATGKDPSPERLAREAPSVAAEMILSTLIRAEESNPGTLSRMLSEKPSVADRIVSVLQSLLRRIGLHQGATRIERAMRRKDKALAAAAIVDAVYSLDGVREGAYSSLTPRATAEPAQHETDTQGGVETAPEPVTREPSPGRTPRAKARAKGYTEFSESEFRRTRERLAADFGFDDRANAADAVIDEDALEGGYNAISNVDFTFSGEIPAELREALQGENMRTRMLFSGDNPQGMGEDWMADLGVDEMIRRARVLANETDPERERFLLEEVGESHVPGIGMMRTVRELREKNAAKYTLFHPDGTVFREYKTMDGALKGKQFQRDAWQKKLLKRSRKGDDSITKADYERDGYIEEEGKGYGPEGALDHPALLPAGATFEIAGETFIVYEDEGLMRAVSEDGEHDFLLEGIESMPITRGSLDRDAGRELETAEPLDDENFAGGIPFAVDRGEDEFGIFGQRTFTPQTGGQRSLFGETEQGESKIARETRERQEAEEKRIGTDPDQRMMFAAAPPSNEEVFDFADQVELEMGLSQLILSMTRNGDLKLDMLEVDPAERNEGVGTRAMERITEYADRYGLRIVLTPNGRDPMRGTTSKRRLIRFYKRFGFVENSGSSKDYSLSAAMYREPNKPDIRFATAWHGTPHDVDRFSTDRIGTGEGAQAYGWGLYFASKREVAEWYRSMLARSGNYMSLQDEWADILVAGEPLVDQFEIAPDRSFIQRARHNNIRGMRIRAESRIDRWEMMLEDEDYEFKEYAKNQLDEWKRLLVDIKAGNVRHAGMGAVYQVNLAPSEDEYLLWDAPMTEQSEKVRQALGIPGPRDMNTEQSLVELARERGVDPAELDEYKAWEKEGDRRYNYENMTGEGFYRLAGTMSNATDRERSMELLGMGIRGIKYLDGSSRNAPVKSVDSALLAAAESFRDDHQSPRDAIEGMRAAYPEETLQDLQDAIDLAYGIDRGDYNYVIFDENDIEIEQRFAVGRDDNQPVLPGTQPVDERFTPYGRPDLANPGKTEGVRGQVDAADELRNEIGLPNARQDEQVEREADVMMQLNRNIGEELIERANAGEILNDAETVVLQRHVNRLGLESLRDGDPRSYEAGLRAIDAYRNSGTNAARAFRMRRDDLKSPAERYREALMGALFEYDPRVRKKFADLRDTINDPSTSPRKKRRAIEEQDTLFKREARRSERVREDLHKAGLNPRGLNPVSMSDPTTAHAVMDTARRARTGVGDALYWIWMNNILSGPLTHMANIIGNSINMMWRFGVVKPIEGAAGTIEGAFGGDPDFTLSDWMVMWKMIGPAMVAGGRNMAVSWASNRQVFDEAILGEKQPTLTFKGEQVQLPDAGPRSKIARAAGLGGYPLKLLMVEDQFFKSFAATLEAYALAHRQAVREGLKGVERANRVQELLSPTQLLYGQYSYANEIWTQSLEEGRKAVFQDDPSKLGQTALELRNGALGGVFKWVIPFVRTPDRIFVRGMHMSWLGAMAGTLNALIKGAEAVKGGEIKWISPLASRREGVAGDIAVAVTSLAVLMLLMGLRDDEEGRPRITGSASRDYRTRAEQYRTAPPQSIRLGGKWYSYSRLEPFATGLAMTIDTLESQEQGGDFLLSPVQSLVAQTRDKTFLRGIGSLVEAFEQMAKDDPDELRGADMLAQLIRRTLITGWVPNLFKQGVRAASPEITESRPSKDDPFWDRQLAGIEYDLLPWAGFADTMRYDVWGREIKRDAPVDGRFAGFMWRLAIPINVSEDDLHPLDLLLDNYNDRVQRGEFGDNPNAIEIHAHPPSRSFTRNGERIEMTSEEYQAFVRDAGRAASERLLGMGLNIEEPGIRDAIVVRDVMGLYYAREREKVYQSRKHVDQTD